MKIFNMPRGAGKSHRMLYASELHNAPILCFNQSQKNTLIEKSQMYGINIPTPITVEQFITNQGRENKEILVDEALLVLESLINHLCYSKTKILGCTLSDEKNSELCRWIVNNTVSDLPLGVLPTDEDDDKRIKR